MVLRPNDVGVFVFFFCVRLFVFWNVFISLPIDLYVLLIGQESGHLLAV